MEVLTAVSKDPLRVVRIAGSTRDSGDSSISPEILLSFKGRSQFRVVKLDAFNVGEATIAVVAFFES